MRELLDHNSIAGNVRMLRAADKTSVIIIAEDDASSRVLKTAVIDEHAVKVVVGHNKANVYGAVAQLRDTITIGVVDADYERVAGLRPPARCFWFDNRDLEVMLICSTAFDRIIGELTDGIEDASACRRKALDACTVIGKCRLNSHLSGSRVSFEGIRPNELYEAARGEISVDALFQWLATQNPQLPPRSILMAGSGFDPRDINRGHDVTAVIAAHLRNRYMLEIGAADIEQFLRVSVRHDDVANSQLVSDLSDWESAHACVILAN